MKSNKARFIALMLMIVIIIVAMAIPMPSIANFMKSAPERDAATVKEAIDRALVQCYALEGAYPPNLDYLAAHYGIQLDRENYFYHYEVFASNLRPTVDVFRLTE